MTYLKILEGKAVYKNRSTFKTWLFGVIRLTALDALRKRGRWKRRSVSMNGIEVQANVSTSGEDNTAQLRMALRQLPPRQREVLHLVFYQEMPLREAAEIMNVSIGSARKHYERAKTKLRAQLKTEGVGE